VRVRVSPFAPDQSDSRKHNREEQWWRAAGFAVFHL